MGAPQGAEEDDYIIPETLMPAKPVRGIKVYEDVIFKRKQQEQQNSLETQTIVANEIEIEEPQKPQRGVKVYEDIIFKRKQEKEHQLLDEIKISQEQEIIKPTDDASIDKEVLPPVQKPQRGIKVYE